MLPHRVHDDHRTFSEIVSATHSAQDIPSKSLIELIVTYRLWRAHLEKNVQNFQHGRANGGYFFITMKKRGLNCALSEFDRDHERAKKTKVAVGKSRQNKSCNIIGVDQRYIIFYLKIMILSSF